MSILSLFLNQGPPQILNKTLARVAPPLAEELCGDCNPSFRPLTSESTLMGILGTELYAGLVPFLTLLMG